MHWLEISGETRHSVWLCADCAAPGEREPVTAPGPEPLVSFLGRGLGSVGGVPSVCAVCGTEGDPQSLSRTQQQLADAGAVVLPSNAQATRFVSRILANLRQEG